VFHANNGHECCAVLVAGRREKDHLDVSSYSSSRHVRFVFLPNVPLQLQAAQFLPEATVARNGWQAWAWGVRCAGWRNVGRPMGPSTVPEAMRNCERPTIRVNRSNDSTGHGCCCIGLHVIDRHLVSRAGEHRTLETDGRWEQPSAGCNAGWM